MRLLLFIILFPGILSAQKVINGTLFLQQEMDLYEQLDLSAGPLQTPGFPLVEKIEFRTETRDFLAEEQEYTFRLSPGTFAKRKAQRNLYRQLSTQADWEMEDFLCDLSYDIQKDWLKLWYLEQLIPLFHEKIKRNEFQDSLYKTDLQKIDLEDLVKLRIDRNDLTIKEEKLSGEKKSLIAFYDIENTLPDFTDLRSLEFLMDLIQTQAAIHTNKKLEKIEQDLAINELEIDLEKAENKQWLDFIQLRYQGPQVDPWEERVSLGIGFILPNSGNRKLKIRELEIDAIQLDREKEVELLKREREISRWQSAIQRDYDMYLIKKSRYEEEHTELISLQEFIIDQEDYKSYFEVEKRLADMEIDLAKSKFELYKDILDYYQKTELLCADIYHSLLFEAL